MDGLRTQEEPEGRPVPLLLERLQPSFFLCKAEGLTASLFEKIHVENQKSFHQLGGSPICCKLFWFSWPSFWRFLGS